MKNLEISISGFVAPLFDLTSNAHHRSVVRESLTPLFVVDVVGCVGVAAFIWTCARARFDRVAEAGRPRGAAEPAAELQPTVKHPNARCQQPRASMRITPKPDTPPHSSPTPPRPPHPTRLHSHTLAASQHPQVMRLSAALSWAGAASMRKTCEVPAPTPPPLRMCSRCCLPLRMQFCCCVVVNPAHCSGGAGTGNVPATHRRPAAPLPNPPHRTAAAPPHRRLTAAAAHRPLAPRRSTYPSCPPPPRSCSPG